VGPAVELYVSDPDSSWCLLALSGAIFFTFGDLKKGGRTSIYRERPAVLGQSRGGDTKLFCLEVSWFVREVFSFVLALEVGNKNEIKTSSAEMKGGTSPTKLLLYTKHKTFWNPRPVIDLASRAVPVPTN
jgi:hypothetical protein